MEKIEIETKNDVRKKNPITNIFLISDIHIGVSRASEDWLENTKEYFEQFLIPLIKKEMNEGRGRGKNKDKEEIRIRKKDKIRIKKNR